MKSVEINSLGSAGELNQSALLNSANELGRNINSLDSSNELSGNALFRQCQWT